LPGFSKDKIHFSGERRIISEDYYGIEGEEMVGAWVDGVTGEWRGGAGQAARRRLGLLSGSGHSMSFWRSHTLLGLRKKQEGAWGSLSVPPMVGINLLAGTKEANHWF